MEPGQAFSRHTKQSVKSIPRFAYRPIRDELLTCEAAYRSLECQVSADVFRVLDAPPGV